MRGRRGPIRAGRSADVQPAPSRGWVVRPLPSLLLALLISAALAGAAAAQMRKIGFASAYVGQTNEPAIRLAEIARAARDDATMKSATSPTRRATICSSGLPENHVTKSMST